MVTLLLACAGSPDKPEPEVRDDSATTSAPDDSGVDDSGADDSGADDTGVDPADLDGDGYASTEFGGDDCDDHDAFTHPGAEEWCDAEDSDCDGDPLAAGVCGKVQEAREGFGVLLVSGDYVSWPLLVGDVTGDGVADLFMASRREDTEYEQGDSSAGVSAVYSGGELGASPHFYPAGAAHAWRESNSATSTGVVVIDGGDVNGDGVGDVLIMDQLYGPATYVHLGPHDDGAETAVDDADVVWYPEDPDQQGTHALSADFDLDGRSDFALMSIYDTLEVFPGGSPSGYPPVVVNGISRGLGGGELNGWMGEVGDLDGDGVQDFVVNLALMSGAEVLTADGASAEDLAETTVGSGSEWSVGWATDPWLDMGDLTGDGIPDLASAGSSTEAGNYDNALLFYDGTLRGGVTTDDAFGSWIWEGIGYSEAQACDLDGDGAVDISATARWEEDSDGNVSLIRGPTNAPGPNDPFPVDRLDFPLDFDVACGPDVTGDGVDDLAFVRQRQDDDDPLLQLVGVVPGFEIPWDDPYYW